MVLAALTVAAVKATIGAVSPTVILSPTPETFSPTPLRVSPTSIAPVASLPSVVEPIAVLALSSTSCTLSDLSLASAMSVCCARRSMSSGRPSSCLCSVAASFCSLSSSFLPFSTSSSSPNLTAPCISVRTSAILRRTDSSLASMSVLNSGDFTLSRAFESASTRFFVLSICFSTTFVRSRTRSRLFGSSFRAASSERAAPCDWRSSAFIFASTAERFDESPLYWIVMPL